MERTRYDNAIAMVREMRDGKDMDEFDNPKRYTVAGINSDILFWVFGVSYNMIDCSIHSLDELAEAVDKLYKTVENIINAILKDECEDMNIKDITTFDYDGFGSERKYAIHGDFFIYDDATCKCLVPYNAVVYSVEDNDNKPETDVLIKKDNTVEFTEEFMSNIKTTKGIKI